MTEPAPTRRVVFTVANPDAKPTDAWVSAVARMLLAHVDREIAREQAAAGQADADGREQEALRDLRRVNKD